MKQLFAARLVVFRS